MARKGLNKQHILTTAKKLVANRELPTAVKVRAILGTGSITTIQKYLKEWKNNCFKQESSLEVKTGINYEHNCSKLIEEKRNLEQNFDKQIAKNEQYAQELINAEKANIVLKEEIKQLQTQLQKLQSELNECKNINNFLEQTTTDIKNKLDNNDNKTIYNLQQTVDVLRAELKKINETSLEALREASTKGHEALMQEKVTSINLQAKLDSLHKELADSKKQLFDATLKYKAQTQVLLRQLDWQQKIIKEHIGDEKLQELAVEPELALNFNNQVAAYAK